jgi:hypothetical protein
MELLLGTLALLLQIGCMFVPLIAILAVIAILLGAFGVLDLIFDQV